MDIVSYLAVVIQTNKEVGVPELGTFLKKKSPGRYDSELHSFLLPSLQLAFKLEVTENILLAEYICKQHNLSEESANYHIDQFVANLKEKLSDNKEIDLQELGKLVLQEGELKFYANSQLNLGFRFYGLPETAEEITFIEKKDTLESVINENNVEVENPGKISEEPVIKPESEIILEEKKEIDPPVAPTQISIAAPEQEKIQEITVNEGTVNYQIEESRKRPIPSYLKIIIGLLILLTLTLALFLWNPDLFDNLTQKQNVPVQRIPAAPVNNAPLSADTLTATDTVKRDTIPVKLSADPIVARPVMPIQKGITFEVIGSSVYSQKEADQFIAFMKRKWGMDAKVVSQRPGKKIKISIATFKDEKTARAARSRIEKKIKIPGLYIYINTNKPE
ncbi:HU family DNA-binding protein [Pedobacter sp. CG_S7]|uniref:HU family DNA-binding protein n=1 Tax=Pedobacter sp. CG_S7 TaxID=3143930 RepID=UPI0033932928